MPADERKRPSGRKRRRRCCRSASGAARQLVLCSRRRKTQRRPAASTGQIDGRRAGEASPTLARRWGPPALTAGLPQAIRVPVGELHHRPRWAAATAAPGPPNLLGDVLDAEGWRAFLRLRRATIRSRRTSPHPWFRGAPRTMPSVDNPGETAPSTAGRLQQHDGGGRGRFWTR